MYFRMGANIRHSCLACFSFLAQVCKVVSLPAQFIGDLPNKSPLQDTEKPRNSIEPGFQGALPPLYPFSFLEIGLFGGFFLLP
jgi:hypothetical protein